MSNLAADEIRSRAALIERNLAEVLTRDELVRLLESGHPINHYIGFEISGRVHLGQGLVAMSKVADFQRAGVRCSILLADWHTWINDKLGGDRDVIRRVALGYFAEAMKAGLRCVGGDPDAVRFVLGTDLYHHNDEYWAALIEVSKHTTLARMQRSISILGRSEGDNVDFAKLIYPSMQVADIFIQGVNLAHAGMDQRKAHVIARDVALQMKSAALRGASGEIIKPIAVHHQLIMGLQKPATWPVPEGIDRRELLATMKMSKSNPRAAIFVHDEPGEIRAKVNKAFCPLDEVELNPVLNWTRTLVFDIGEGPFSIERRLENGGPVTYTSYQDVERSFLDRSLHPGDLKSGLATWLIDRLAPARAHFAQPSVRAHLDELDRLLG